MTANRKPSSPLFGWVAAGADLLSAQVEQVTGVVSKQIDATHALFEDLQHRGEEVDSQIRQSLNPSSVFSSLQNMIMANPLISLIPGSRKAAVKEQQLELLSAKVDLLVEQIALLAAKRAAEEKKAKPATKSTRSGSSRTTKSAASTASKTDSAAEKKPATQRRSSSSSSAGKKTAGSAGTARKTTTRRKSTTTKKAGE